MKSEKDKLLNQEYYISWDKELTERRERAKDLLFDFSNLKPSKRYKRDRTIQK